MMKMRVINDGLTLTGVWDGTEAGFGFVRFKYRRALPEAVYDYQSRAHRLDASGRERMVAIETLLFPGPVSRLVEWDVVNERDEQVQPSREALRMVPASFINRICDCVCSYAGPEKAEFEKNSGTGCT